MTMTEFLTQEATGKFRTIDALAKRAKEVGFLKSSEPQYKFAELLGEWFARFPKGKLDNGYVYYVELPFKGRLKVRHPNGRNVGSIRVSKCPPTDWS
jgi:hypothetical protein